MPTRDMGLDLPKVQILPNTRMLLSLRNNTLTSEEAIADLVDNSLDQDVGATKIHIIKEADFISIADNGRGMTLPLLIDAMTFGSKGQDRPTANDLGLFGIGLKNAAGTIAKRLTVITRNEQDKMYTAVYDLEEIVKSDEFAIPIYPSKESEQKKFKSLIDSPTGTVLLLEKLDGPKFTPNKLKAHLGEVFRIFIHNGVEISVNETILEPIFPLKSPFGDDVEINDQVYDFTKPDGTPFSLRIIFGFFPLALKTEGARSGLTLANQGFYILRNDRQLEKAKWFDVVAKHNDFNRLRAEIYYTGDLDDVFRTNYEKNTLKLDQWFRDALKTKLNGQFASYKQRNVQDYGRERLKLSEVEEQDFKRIKDDIESKGARIPKLHNNKTIKTEPQDSKPSARQEGTSTQLPEHKSTLPTKVDLIQFDTGRLEASRICLFEDVGNGAVKIRYNVDHPFYRFFVAQSVEVKDVFAKLFFVMGRSILNIGTTEEIMAALDDFQLKFGDEYRKLLE